VNVGADVIVAQGIDAGGHGAAEGASIISLVPELRTVFPRTPILAAGGIGDARGVLAALSLGADGVVMGTRFAASAESAIADKAKDLILNTHDAGVTTKRYLFEHADLELNCMTPFEDRECGFNFQNIMDGQL
jgi:nitronate monooxygenase